MKHPQGVRFYEIQNQGTHMQKSFLNLACCQINRKSLIITQFWFRLKSSRKYLSEYSEIIYGIRDQDTKSNDKIYKKKHHFASISTSLLEHWKHVN